MKTLTPLQLETLRFKERNAIRTRMETDPIFHELKKLDVGHALLIERAEWKNKRSPASKVYKIGNQIKSKFSLRTLQDNSGWVATRIK